MVRQRKEPTAATDAAWKEVKVDTETSGHGMIMGPTLQRVVRLLGICAKWCACHPPRCAGHHRSVYDMALGWRKTDVKGALVNSISRFANFTHRQSEFQSHILNNVATYQDTRYLASFPTLAPTLLCWGGVVVSSFFSSSRHCRANSHLSPLSSHSERCLVPPRPVRRDRHRGRRDSWLLPLTL